MSKVCCFTGRRPKDLFGYKKEPYLPLMEKLKKDIVMLYNEGYDTFISGGAQGFDQLAFWAVNALKRDLHLPIKNIVYVPFKGQELAWKGTGLFDQKEYALMLRLADDVRYLREVNTNDMKQVVSALYGRNHDMVEASDLVFGLYPDYSWQMPQVKGGTAECLRYAQSKGKKIYQMSHETLRSQYIV